MLMMRRGRMRTDRRWYITTFSISLERKENSLKSFRFWQECREKEEKTERWGQKKVKDKQGKRVQDDERGLRDGSDFSFGVHWDQNLSMCVWRQFGENRFGDWSWGLGRKRLYQGKLEWKGVKVVCVCVCADNNTTVGDRTERRVSRNSSEQLRPQSL